MSKLASIGNMPEILRITEVLKTCPQVDLPLQHFYLPGVCVRSMFMPAGTLLAGKIHKHAHIAILAQGTLRLADDEHAFVISAPYIAYGKAGIKRLGYAETDCTFMNVLSTDITDPDELEAAMTCETFEELDQFLLENNHEPPKQIT